MRCSRRGICSTRLWMLVPIVNSGGGRIEQALHVHTSPNVVVAVSWKFTATVVPEPEPEPEPTIEVPPVPMALTCKATAVRAGIVALNIPEEVTLNLPPVNTSSCQPEYSQCFQRARLYPPP